MLEKVSIDLTESQHALVGAIFRYEALDRLARITTARGVRVLAFGFGRTELRLVLEGEPSALQRSLASFKVGTRRAAWHKGVKLRRAMSWRDELPEDRLLEAVVWAHGAPVEAGACCALASPWSSHRDVLGFRRARFYDPAPLQQRLDLRELAQKVGEKQSEPPFDPPGDLSFLLRIAAAVLGVLPTDRRCFRLFVHLARALGFANAPLADVLALTVRRVRQLAAEVEPLLPLALLSVNDRRLARVP